MPTSPALIVLALLTVTAPPVIAMPFKPRRDRAGIRGDVNGTCARDRYAVCARRGDRAAIGDDIDVAVARHGEAVRAGCQNVMSVVQRDKVRSVNGFAATCDRTVRQICHIGREGFDGPAGAPAEMMPSLVTVAVPSRAKMPKPPPVMLPRLPVTVTFCKALMPMPVAGSVPLMVPVPLLTVRFTFR